MHKYSKCNVNVFPDVIIENHQLFNDDIILIRRLNDQIRDWMIKYDDLMIKCDHWMIKYDLRVEGLVEGLQAWRVEELKGWGVEGLTNGRVEGLKGGRLDGLKGWSVHGLKAWRLKGWRVAISVSQIRSSSIPEDMVFDSFITITSLRMMKTGAKRIMWDTQIWNCHIYTFPLISWFYGTTYYKWNRLKHCKMM